MFDKKWNKEVESLIRTTVENTIAATLTDASSILARQTTVLQLNEDIEKLKVEKGRREWEYQKKEEGLEHKVGLERRRQEFEIEQAKREALVSVREENLESDKARFDEQLTFHEERFATEVGYLKDMVAQVLNRLPNIDVSMKAETKTKRK